MLILIKIFEADNRLIPLADPNIGATLVKTLM